MSSPTSRRYSEALARLKVNNPADMQAIKRRVESWKEQCNNWRAEAQSLRRTVAQLEAQIKELTHPRGDAPATPPAPSPPLTHTRPHALHPRPMATPTPTHTRTTPKGKHE